MHVKNLRKARFLRFQECTTMNKTVREFLTKVSRNLTKFGLLNFGECNNNEGNVTLRVDEVIKWPAGIDSTSFSKSTRQQDFCCVMPIN